jgi:hypothetical protein
MIQNDRVRFLMILFILTISALPIIAFFAHIYRTGSNSVGSVILDGWITITSPISYVLLGLLIRLKAKRSRWFVIVWFTTLTLYFINTMIFLNS